MKTFLLLVCLFCATPFTYALEQNHLLDAGVQVKPSPPSFSFVRGHKQGKNHTVTWGMTSNAGIDYFIIECTYEDPNDPYSVWQTVGMMPCVNHPIHKFTDSPVLPGTLNYRIIAVMEDNSTVTSWFYTTIIR